MATTFVRIALISGAALAFAFGASGSAVAGCNGCSSSSSSGGTSASAKGSASASATTTSVNTATAGQVDLSGHRTRGHVSTLAAAVSTTQTCCPCSKTSLAAVSETDVSASIH